LNSSVKSLAPKRSKTDESLVQKAIFMKNEIPLFILR
jgi:hypothetical protein